MTTIRRAMFAVLLAAPFAFAGAPAFAQEKDIVDTAAGDTSLSTLVAAVKAAGLVETLKGKGPFTVFAPTDEAFKKLPAGTLDSLLKPENKKRLASILTFHVLPGTYDAARITKAKVKVYGIKSVEGSNVEVDLRKGVMVSGATVTKPDIKTSNGVVHVIDTVIIPRKVKFAMAAEAAKETAKAAFGKASAATKAAAGKAVEAVKGAATKAKEAMTPAPAPAPATTPAPAGTPVTPAPAPAPKKP